MERNICIFGDSITWGAFGTEKGGWVDQLKVSFFEDFKAVYNLGIPGDITDDILGYFQNESRVREANVLIFAIGINDSQYIKSKNNPRTSLEKFKSNLRQIIQKSREFTKDILFIGLTDVDEARTMPIPWRENVYYDNENISIYDQAIQEICAEEKAHYLSMRGVLGKSDLSDGVHPDSKGHEKMFLKIRDFVVENLNL